MKFETWNMNESTESTVISMNSALEHINANKEAPFGKSESMKSWVQSSKSLIEFLSNSTPKMLLGFTGRLLLDKDRSFCSSQKIAREWAEWRGQKEKKPEYNREVLSEYIKNKTEGANIDSFIEGAKEYRKWFRDTFITALDSATAISNANAIYSKCIESNSNTYTEVSSGLVSYKRLYDYIDPNKLAGSLNAKGFYSTIENTGRGYADIRTLDILEAIKILNQLCGTSFNIQDKFDPNAGTFIASLAPYMMAVIKKYEDTVNGNYQKGFGYNIIPVMADSAFDVWIQSILLLYAVDCACTDIIGAPGTGEGSEDSNKPIQYEQWNKNLQSSFAIAGYKYIKEGSRDSGFKPFEYTDQTALQSALEDPKHPLKVPQFDFENMNIEEAKKTAPSVAFVQLVLSMSNFYKGKIDGAFGPATRSAVIEYQNTRKDMLGRELNKFNKTSGADGIVGPRTLHSLMLEYFIKTSPEISKVPSMPTSVTKTDLSKQQIIQAMEFAKMNKKD